MKTILIATVIATGVLAGAANASQVQTMSSTESAKLSGYEPTGEHVDCLRLRQVRSVKALSETTFLIDAGGVYYLSEARGGCMGASGRDTQITFSTTSPELCASQPITVIDLFSQTTLGTCTLGSFEKMRKKSAGGHSPT